MEKFMQFELEFLIPKEIQNEVQWDGENSFNLEKDDIMTIKENLLIIGLGWFKLNLILGILNVIWILSINLF
jgi:hypothetical protein